ncbi:hypothetical protein LZ31DRAFT_595154 [Colletotrichum somersetense]|nr:hypothetical protein LZ31DRAFT_595154 [Colletotrichum somersetense]
MQDDVVIVTSSGDKPDLLEDDDDDDGHDYGRNNNSAHDHDHDQVIAYPAILGPTTDVIVVGAVASNGYRALFSRGTQSQVTVSAPGFVTCTTEKSKGYYLTAGTSYAAPSVAGVIAVWLSRPEYKNRLQVKGNVAANIKTMVQDLAYSRVKG